MFITFKNIKTQGKTKKQKKRKALKQPRIFQQSLRLRDWVGKKSR